MKSHVDNETGERYQWMVFFPLQNQYATGKTYEDVFLKGLYENQPFRIELEHIRVVNGEKRSGIAKVDPTTCKIDEYFVTEDHDFGLNAIKKVPAGVQSTIDLIMR